MPSAPANVRVLPERGSTSVEPHGAVDSAQEAIATLPERTLDQLWHPHYLERLARSYWRYLTRVSLGLIRVVYAPHSRTVVLLTSRLPLLRFRAPEYEAAGDGGSVTWRIERGLLVAREGRGKGYLRIAVRRLEQESTAQAEGLAALGLVVEVRNFYPWLRGSGRFARFGAWLYRQTQARIHRRVTFGFLRSLANLDLPPSRIGALAGEIDMGAEAARSDSDVSPRAAAGRGDTR